MDEYLTLASERPGHRQPAEFARCPKLSRASDWLKHRLKDGDALILDVMAEAKDNGISYRTLRSAKIQWECASTHRSDKDQWDWSLPTLKPGVDPNGTGDMPVGRSISQVRIQVRNCAPEKPYKTGQMRNISQMRNENCASEKSNAQLFKRQKFRTGLLRSLTIRNKFKSPRSR